jgi:hypothetical protein
MPAPEKASPGACGLIIGLGVLALLSWALALATLADLAGSDRPAMPTRKPMAP